MTADRVLDQLDTNLSGVGQDLSEFQDSLVDLANQLDVSESRVCACSGSPGSPGRSATSTTLRCTSARWPRNSSSRTRSESRVCS
jgi:hypothetical protein